MPIKSTKTTEALTGPSLQSANNVFLAAELARLAEDWARSPYTFGTVDLDRYRELCDYFDVDGVSLLHATQNRDVNREGLPEQTTTMPAFGDIQKSSS